MHYFQSIFSLNKAKFLLPFLLILLIVKGIFFALALPFFQGPDEQTHFAQIERWAEPSEKTWPIRTESKYEILGNDIRTNHFPEEIINSAYYLQFDEIKFQAENTQSFSMGSLGPNENTIRTGSWKQYLDVYPPTTSETWSLYYYLGSKTEKALGDTSIFFRFFSLRFFSVLLGTFTVLLAYLTAKKVGLSPLQSLLVAILIAFQPMIQQTTAIINYDALLIFSFSLYFYAAVLLMREGLSTSRLTLLIGALLIAFLSKGPGIVLFGITYFLVAYLVYQKVECSFGKFLKIFALITGVLIGLTFLIIPSSFLINILALDGSSQFSNIFLSLGKYLNKTLRLDTFFNTYASYWGNFGWLDTRINNSILSIAAGIELFSIIGLFGYFFSKERKLWLPSRDIIFFSLSMIVALQLAIRFYDWRIFDSFGYVVIGQPGRYFLPNIIPHMLLVVTGLGFFTKNEKQFQRLLLWLALGMILLSLYALFFVILPRYYL